MPLTIIGRAYTDTQLACKPVNVLAKATSDARDRACGIASEAGVHTKAITKADTGMFQITAPNSTETLTAAPKRPARSTRTSPL